MKLQFSAVFIAICSSLLLSCASLFPNARYTQEYTPREGQAMWYTAEGLTLMSRRIASCISASEMITDHQRARKVYAEYLRVCFETISMKGEDVDGGIRALNLIKHLHKKASGDTRFWKEVVELARSTTDTTLKGSPIPDYYN